MGLNLETKALGSLQEVLQEVASRSIIMFLALHTITDF